MSTYKFVQHKKISLKNNPDFNEAWLQTKIAENPGIIGLGDLALVERERRQERAGRLDLLLADFENDSRFEVELMLGKLDESHIIRCIEYWDNERRRYPGYDHTAVIVAEDITSRFINVLSLFAGNIPLVAIQLNALVVGENIILDFVKILDQRQLRMDDTVDAKLEEVNRDYWIAKGTKQTVKIADQALEIMNETLSSPRSLNFNKHYIGLTNGTVTTASIAFQPRKMYCIVIVRSDWTEEDLSTFEQAGLEVDTYRGKLRLKLNTSDIKNHRDLIAPFLHRVAAAL